MTRNVLLKRLGLIRVAFVAGVGLPLIIATSARAQNPAPAGAEAQAERVIVTGSNIPTAEEVGPNPVLSLNRDLINKSGERTTEDLLKHQPIANSNSVPAQNNATSQGGPAGTASVSLRGFDNIATLVLIDGRRVVPFPGGGFVDLLTIPLPAVESIEILKDGASATYGADAVAGVINIKLYKDYRGAQVTLEYGNTLDKDAGVYSGDVLFGVGDDKVSISGDIFYYHHNSLFNRDRGNSANPPFLSSNASPWNLQVSRATVLEQLGLPPDFGGGPDLDPNFRKGSYPLDAADFMLDSNGNTILSPAGLAEVGHNPLNFTNRNDATNMAKIPGVRKLVGVDGQGPNGTGPYLGFLPNNIFFATAPTGTNGFAPPSSYRYSNGRPRAAFSVLPGFNFNAFSGSYPQQERWGGYAAFSDKICDDQLQIYGDFYYADSKSHDELAPGATNNFITKGQGTIAIPPHMDLNGVAPPGTPTFAETGVPEHAFNPFNPFNQIISNGTRARLADFGNRLIDNENEAFLATLGVKGDKLFDGNWGYNAGFRYSEILDISQIKDVNVVRFNRVMNQNDVLFTDPGSLLFGKPAFNPFGDFRHPIAANAPTLDFATLYRRDLNTSKLAGVDASMYTTDLFDLPGGPVGLAFGAGWRRESFFANPDDQGRLKEEAGVGQSRRIQAGRKDYDLWAETQIPLFSPEMGIWGLHSVELGASGRFEYFRNNNTDVLVPKVTLRWQPFDDQLTFRSTWSEGFIEPTLFALFSGPAFTLAPTTLVKIGGTSEPETSEEVDSNKKLTPEDSRAWTGGFVYTPKWIQNVIPNSTLTVHVDFWDIERTGVVVIPTAQEVVNRFLAGKPLPGEEVTIDSSSGTVTFVRTSYFNAGRENSRGVDLGFQYQLQTDRWGTWTWLTEATYLDSFIFQPTAASIGHEVSGRANNDPFEGAFFGQVTGGDGWAKWKGTSSIDWAWHNFDLNWAVQYLDGWKEEINNAAGVAANLNIIAAGAGLPATATGLNTPAHEHFVHGTWFQDAFLSYSLIFTPPVESQPVAGYSKGGKEVMTNKEGKAIESTAAYSMPCWKTILNNSTIKLGVNNIFGQDPPKEFGFGFGNSVNYPGFSYDNIGRFVYLELKKKF